MLLGAASGIVLTLEAHSHLVFNPSASEPVGWYRLTDVPPSRNGLVLLRSPLKKLVALPGDIVTWSAKGVSVNGRLLPNSAVPADSPYPPYHYGTQKLQEGQYLVMGRDPLSWDSRYYGAVPQVLIAHSVQPLWSK